MLKLGIIKFSKSKSMSKPMHLAALHEMGINGEYDVYECAPDDLESLIANLKKNNVRGLNVTIPHKIPIMNLVDKLSENAKLIGAVNTIINEDGTLIGENTDLHGFWNAIPLEIQKTISGSEVSLIGAGGAACACAIALIKNKCAVLNIYGRDLNKLTDFKNDLDSKKKEINSNTSIRINLLSNVDLSRSKLLVNTTPVGMSPNIHKSPLKIKDLKKLPKDCLVYDIIYNPSETLLLQEANSLGFKILNGVDMLVLQGAESLKMWLEKDNVPIEVMRNAVLKSLTVSE